MKKIELINEFIELRALGYPYDEIVSKLGVSKVTLIRWSKKYYQTIDLTKKEMVQISAEKIALKNSNLLMKFAELVLSEFNKGKKKPEIEEVIMKRFYRNVFGVYARKMKGLKVNFDHKGIPNNITIEWKDEGE